MSERIHAYLSDVRVALKVESRTKTGGWIASFLDSEVQIVQYAYLPPYHLDREGNAVEFFNRCIDHVDGVIVDSNEFRSSLCQLWGLEQENQVKLVVPGEPLDNELALTNYW